LLLLDVLCEVKEKNALCGEHVCPATCDLVSERMVFSDFLEIRRRSSLRKVVKQAWVSWKSATNK